MATRLVAAGFDVRAFDRADAAVRAFAEAGGDVAQSPAAAAADADVVVTMLPDSAAVRAVLIDGDESASGAMVPDGDESASGAMVPDGLVIDMSSSAPLDTRRLGAALSARGCSLVDAPVSGGVAKAIEGTLSIMLGGEDYAAKRAGPMLTPMGANIFRTGPLGSGHAMKALNNYVSAAGLIAACEAVRIAAAFGLDPALAVDVLNASTGRNNSTENKLKQQILSGRFASGFGLALMTKDVGIAADLGTRLELDTPLSGAIAALANEALAALGPASDHTEIDRHRN